MILVYAGRRPGADFPEENESFVATQIEQVLGGLRPRRVVGSAAAGADLLVLRAAAEYGIPADVFVAGDQEAFRSDSVQDKGERWARDFDALLGSDRVTVTEVPEHGDPDDTYKAVTSLMAQHPDTLAEDREEVVVLAIATPREDGVDHTEELVAHARANRRLVLRIDPARTEDDSPRAFVAMPFGTKPYVDRGWRRYDADLTYHRVMLPALIDAGLQPMRADTDALLEIIDHTMLREINRAAVMAVDLAMLNPNVMWELGVRHAWRRSGTILMAPEWVRAPFDISHAPVFHYRRTAQRIADADAVAGIRELQKLLVEVDAQRVDSPIFAHINHLPDVEIPDLDAVEDDETAGELLVAATQAGDLGDGDELLAVADRVRGHAELTTTVRTALLEQIGLALVGLNQHDRAREVLGPIAEADAGFERRRVQEVYAHALIRSGQADDDEARLAEAERRLQAIIDRHGPTGETLGLLGSTFKRRVELALQKGDAPHPGHLERAITAYRAGVQFDMADYYPGINAVALLRLRAQRFGGTDEDTRDAEELLHVVRFALRRNEAADEDLWATLTLGECALHQHLLTGDADTLAAATRHYAAGAVGIVGAQQKASATRQLRMMRDAGDPAEVLDPLLALFE